MRARFERMLSLGFGRVLTVCAALACLGAAPAPGLSDSGVLQVRFGGDRQQTRVVLELDRSTRGKLADAGADGRVSLVLAGAAPSTALEGVGQGLVRTWTVSSNAGGASLDLVLSRPAEVTRRFLLAPSEGSPNYRYVLDLTAVSVVSDPSSTPSSIPAATAVSRPPVRVQKVVAIVPIHARRVVVIDAGHGGKDPGALGGESQEKDLTLAAAKALKRRLERDGRYVVVLTRKSDTFVPLVNRVQIARAADADLFISLHADAGGDPAVHGATVYTLSDKGSDRVARKLFDNNDWFINVAMPSRDRAVNQILLDLTQRATKNESSAFAETLVDRIGDFTGLVQRSHRDAGYVVLLAPDVPAVLLEMGFITNAQDESDLQDVARRTRLMDSVGDAIDDYFAPRHRFAAR